MEKVLIVEDSRLIARGLQVWIQRDLSFECELAFSMAEAKELLSQKSRKYFVALLDINLPDAPNGEVVDFVIKQGVPSIVVTASYDEATRSAMMSKDIADYVVKKPPKEMGELLKLIQRIYNNKETKVLVVDDSRMFRSYYKRILENQKLTVFEAEDGRQALELFTQNPDIKLILTDYHMPGMNGLELTQRIRRNSPHDKTSIIVFSTDDKRNIAPRFIKAGANDYISKSASVEEFLCRVNMNLNFLDSVAEIKESANRDFLTKIYNRKYFFEVAEDAYTLHKSLGKPIAVAMLDIDFFKQVNDQYGHLAGDMVIKHVASFLKEQARGVGVLARFGGEEFCVMLTTMPEQGVFAYFDFIRKELESEPVSFNGQPIHFTVSIGVTQNLGKSLEDMISIADENLYEAKNTGRNKVIFLQHAC